MKPSQKKRLKKSIKEGDIYILGDHLLVCGDSTSQSVLKWISEEWKIKLILTDPPYGVDYVESKAGFKQFGQAHKSIANDHIQSDETYKKFTTNWLDVVKERLLEKNSFYIFNSDKMIFSLKTALDATEFKLSQLLIWIKNASVIGRLDYQPQHELIAYGWYGKHEFLKSKDKSIILYPKIKKNNLHPTMKPLGLLRRLILNSSKIGDVIYDPFGGSGSTLIACEQTKRKCLMVELDTQYCQVIIDRFRSVSSEEVKLLNNDTNG